MEQFLERPPLEDPQYEPKHPPMGGRIPAAVTRFGPRTQLRWFRRFRREIDWRQDASGFYCDSPHHAGPCCGSCIGEFEDGWAGGGVIMDGWCCCRDARLVGR